MSVATAISFLFSNFLIFRHSQASLGNRLRLKGKRAARTSWQGAKGLPVFAFVISDSIRLRWL
jgi:hypothetical protein